MKPFLMLLALFAAAPCFAQTTTVKQLYDEYRANKAAFETRYRNQRITVTGKVRSISVASPYWKDQDVHKIHLTATGYENFVSCILPYGDSLQLQAVKAGEMITVTGTVPSTFSDAIYLSNCTITTGTQPTAIIKTAPVDAPLGKYEVYQRSGSGFNYQYRFELKSYTSYQLGGKTGSCNYDSKTKVIRFSSGPLKGFAGIYRSVTDNEKDPPGFLLNANGSVPLINGSHTGYQFAYFKG